MWAGSRTTGKGFNVNAMAKIRLWSLLLLLAGIVASGCTTTTLPPRKPLYDSAQKQSDFIAARYSNAVKSIEGYYDKYPPVLEALAVASARYDAAREDLNAAQAKLVELTALRRQLARLKEALPENADAVAVKSLNDEIRTLDKQLAEQHANVALAESAVWLTKNQLDAGFNGLGAIAEAIVAVDFDKQGIPAGLAELFGNNAQFLSAVNEKLNNQDHFAGLGAVYLAAMKRDRNDILNELIPAAKEYHKMLQRYLFYSRGRMNIAFDGALLATTGTAAVAGSESVARVLAALATGIAGLRESIDKELFFQQASSALLLLMEADIAEKEAKLRDGMAKGVGEYSLEDGIRDYNTFLLAGQLTDAIMALNEEAVEKAMSANQHLQKLEEAAQQNLTALQKREQEKEQEQKERLQWLMEQLSQPGATTTP